MCVCVCVCVRVCACVCVCYYSILAYVSLMIVHFGKYSVLKVLLCSQREEDKHAAGDNVANKPHILSNSSGTKCRASERA